MPFTRRGRSEGGCLMCDNPNTPGMVQCDTCKGWAHFTCANVDSSVNDPTVTFECVNCLAQKSLTVPAEDNQNLKDFVTPTLSIQAPSFRPPRATGLQPQDESNRDDRTANAMEEMLNIIKAMSTKMENSEQRTEERFRQNEQRFQKFEKSLNIPSSSYPIEANVITTDKCNKTQVDDNEILPIDDDHSISSSASQQRTQYNEVVNESKRVNDDVEPTGLEMLAVSLNRQHLQKLPIFSGDVRTWASFESIFNKTTRDGKFTETENVARLSEALKGDALSLVSDLMLYGKSASAIMQELREFYGKSHDLVVALTDEIFAFKKIDHATDPKLKELALKLRNLVANLISMNEIEEMSNMYMIRKIVQKLPMPLFLKWERKVSEIQTREFRKPTVQDVAKYVMERVKEIPTSFPKVQVVANTVKPKTSNQSTTKRVMSHQQSAPLTSSVSSRTISCFKCKGNHTLTKCPDFQSMTTKERYQCAYDNRVCQSCLSSTSHVQKNCPTLRVCGKSGCNKNHHRMLHYENQKNREGESNPQSQTQASTSTAIASASAASNDTQVASKTGATMSHHVQDSVLYKIIPVRIQGEEGRVVDTFAFLDDGSSLTLIDASLVDDLKLSGEHEVLHLQWTKGIKRVEESICVSINISGAGHKKCDTLKNVFTVENLDLPVQSCNVAELRQHYHHLRGLPISDYENAKPKILIGLRHANLLMSGNNKVGKSGEPIASKTRLGWVVYGVSSPTLNFTAAAHKHSVMHLSVREASKSDEELHNLVKHHFTTESFGIKPPINDLMSEENQRAIEVMKRTMKFVGDRYEIGLLWKSENIKLPNSYSMALRRLTTLETSLKKKPDLLKWKCDYVRQLLEKGYARKATEIELNQHWDRIWYCPTFVVVNQNKVPPKPRVVSDVAAQVNGRSLNSFLLKGPDNLIPIFAGLFRFREEKVAVTGDVKEMFHQTQIIAADQQCQRFLWRDGNQTRKPDVYIMQRMMFGPTCSPTCAQFIKNQHAMKFVEELPDAVNALVHHTYVDDFFSSHSSVEHALKVSSDAIAICKSMGLDLTGFQSNSRKLLEKLPESKRKDSLIDICRQDDDVTVSKILGMYWNSSTDNFTYKVTKTELIEKMLLDEIIPTKRQVLKTLMKIFDPLGLIAHYLIRGKIVLQEIWREGVDWDESIPHDLNLQWREFISELTNIERLTIPRHYANIIPQKYVTSLVVFVDASEQAFATSAYFRFVSGNDVHIAHVMGKSKVAPVKKLTIPQLELQAAVLGVRLASTIKRLHSFNIEKTIYLSDSKVTLQWICSKKFKFKTFVAARVGEILDTSSNREWFHVSSENNVADDATKWSTPTMGNNDERWFRGADFLKLPFEEWPIKSPDEFCAETEEKEQFRIMIHRSRTRKQNRFKALDEIKPRFTTDWSSFVRIVARLQRIARRFKTNDFATPLPSFITPEEVHQTEILIFKKIQFDSFEDEIEDLKSKQHVQKSSKIFALNPFLHDDVIRMSSRAQHAEVSYATKNPIILPNKHPLVDVYIQKIHEKNFHIGQEKTIADVREKVWIIDLRSAVQRVFRNCQMCKIRKASPKFPRMGNLPVPRVDFGVKPFYHTGLDAFGPFLVRVGRSNIKRWGLIFTCMTYRAVHIEVLYDMSTEHCLMAIRRFLCRRGQVVHFYSDRGTNFVGANNILHKDLSELQKTLGEKVANNFKIHWHFQPAYSPWFGGAWERLIQSIKKCLEFLLTGETHREEVLVNALIEAEFWMNNRPLTHIPIDPESMKPLTPNSILFGDDDEDKAKAVGVFTVYDKFSPRASRRSQHLVDKFLHRWVREYLPTLIKRSKWHEDVEEVKTGDVVILIEPTEIRDSCKRGIITNTYPGSDNRVRAADVRLSDGTIKKNRSVGRIAVLDVKSSSLADSDGPRDVAEAP